MKDIALIDKNFAIKTEIERDDIAFYDIDDAPFKIYGVFREGDRYRRMPEEAAKKVGLALHGLHTHTAGGRVRFRTDSTFVAIHTELGERYRAAHFAASTKTRFTA